MQDSSAHIERSYIRHLSNGENTLYEKAALSVAILAIALVIAHTLYVFRFRYHEMAFDLYYHWTKRFSSGINPFRALPHCNYPPPFLILLSPLTLLSQQSAYWIWQAIQVAAFFLSVFMMLREIAPLTVVRLTIRTRRTGAAFAVHLYEHTLRERTVRVVTAPVDRGLAPGAARTSRLGRIHARVGNGTENLSGLRRRLFSFSAPPWNRRIGCGLDTDPGFGHRSEALDRCSRSWYRSLFQYARMGRKRQRD